MGSRNAVLSTPRTLDISPPLAGWSNLEFPLDFQLLRGTWFRRFRDRNRQYFNICRAQGETIPPIYCPILAGNAGNTQYPYLQGSKSIFLHILVAILEARSEEAAMIPSQDEVAQVVLVLAADCSRCTHPRYRASESEWRLGGLVALTARLAGW